MVGQAIADHHVTLCGCVPCVQSVAKKTSIHFNKWADLVCSHSLLDFGAFSRPVLLQLGDDLAGRVFLPEGPQVLRCQWGAVSFHNKPAEGSEGGGGGGGHMSHAPKQAVYRKQVRSVPAVGRLKKKKKTGSGLPGEPPEEDL